MRYKITCDQAIAQVLGQLSGPLDEAEFIERVLQLWPSQAKNPQQSVKSKLNYRPDVVRLEGQRLASAAYIFRGTQFRLQLNALEREGGGPLSQRFVGFMPFPLLFTTPQFTDAGTGHRIPCRPVEVGAPRPPNWCWDPEVLYEMAPWLEEVGYQAEDSLIVEIRDYSQNDFLIRREPAAERQEEQIARQNERLAAALQQVLRTRSLSPFELVPQLYAALPTCREYPGDPWSLVVRRDDRYCFTPFGNVMRGPAPQPLSGSHPRLRSFPEDEAYTRVRQRAQQEQRGELEQRYQEFQREYTQARRAAGLEGPPAGHSRNAHAGRLPTRRLARNRSDQAIQLFDQYLQRQGQSAPSREQKSKDLERFSEFLAERHHRCLSSPNFALMEEFFFQWYPRTADQPSLNVLRRLFTSLKQFYEYWAMEGHPEGAQCMEVLFSLKEWAERKLALAQQVPPGEAYEDLRQAWLGPSPRRRPQVRRSDRPWLALPMRGSRP